MPRASLRAPFIVVMTVAGCSDPASTSENASDSSVIDSYPDIITSDNPPCLFMACDTGTTPPIDCTAPLPADFACGSIKAKAGQKVCAEASLTELMTCFVAGGEKACEAARAKHPDCDKCLTEWKYGERFFDVGACMHLVDPASGCGEAWRCERDCVAAACAECDDSPGSGKTPGGSALSECDARMRNAADAGTGTCYERATRDLDLCRLHPTVAVCFVDKAEDVLRFYRGACRDGGDWSKALSPG